MSRLSKPAPEHCIELQGRMYLATLQPISDINKENIRDPAIMNVILQTYYSYLKTDTLKIHARVTKYIYIYMKHKTQLTSATMNKYL